MSNDMALALENRPMVENPLDNLAAAIKGITFKLTVGGQKVTPANAAQVLAREDLAVSDRDRILRALEGVQRQNKVLGSTLPLYPNDPLIDVIQTANGGVIPILASNETATVTYDGIEGVNPADTSFIEMPKWSIKLVNGLTIAALFASSVAPLGSVGKSIKGPGEHSGGPKLDFKAGVLAALAAFLAACQKAGIIPTNTTSPQLTSTPQSPDTQVAVLTATPSAVSPEAQPTYTGAIISQGRGGGGGEIAYSEEIYLSSLPKDLTQQYQIVGVSGEKNGDKLCVDPTLCYYSANAYPLPFTTADGTLVKYNAQETLNADGLPVYTNTDGTYRIVQAPIRLENGKQIVLGLKAGKFVYLEITSSGWRELNMEVMNKLSPGATAVPHWKDGFLGLGDQTISLSETPATTLIPFEKITTVDQLPVLTREQLAAAEANLDFSDLTPAPLVASTDGGVSVGGGGTLNIYLGAGLEQNTWFKVALGAIVDGVDTYVIKVKGPQEQKFALNVNEFERNPQGAIKDYTFTALHNPKAITLYLDPSLDALFAQTNSPLEDAVKKMATDEKLPDIFRLLAAARGWEPGHQENFWNILMQLNGENVPLKIVD